LPKTKPTKARRGPKPLPPGEARDRRWVAMLDTAEFERVEAQLAATGQTRRELLLGLLPDRSEA
jgi:hypothetical protein